jgi:glycosyltransferase involved in cell wall biosynthesis
MSSPLVSVICLCYNHERFVTEAIQSVLNQTYRNLEIIIVDDKSTDRSRDQIERIAAANDSIVYIPLSENVGICKAFNRGLAKAKGEFIVDFATDDIFDPERIKKQVDRFEQLDSSYGVVFTDAFYVNAEGKVLRRHVASMRAQNLINQIPQGDVYADLIERYFVAAPTMLVRREVLSVLNGYDESLAYEDFDFWIRSSRLFKYSYIGEPLTMIRKHDGSMSLDQYKKGDPQLESTYRVCLKALELNKTPREKIALTIRVRYEFRQSVFSENFREAGLFFELLKKLESPSISYWLLQIAMHMRLPLLPLRRLYHRVRFN